MLIMALRIRTSLVLGLAVFLFSCSLKTMSPVREFRIRLPEPLRDEPLLTQMTHFAIAVSGGVSDTLRPSDVGNRSLDCLNLNGQVFFAYTLNQLLSGVQISLSQGQYRFTILAFANGVGNPSTISGLYSSSPALKAYVVAQAQADTRTSSSVTLLSTYQPASVSDLLLTCPIPPLRYNGIFSVTNNLRHYRFDGGLWSFSPIGDPGYSREPSIYTDAAGYVHIAYSYFFNAFEALRYITNQSGSYVETTVVAGTSGNEPTAITQTTNGSIYILSITPTSAPNLRLIRRGVSSWTEEDSPLSGDIFTSLVLEPGPNNSLLVAAQASAFAEIKVTTGAAGGGFAAPTSINTAGAESCNSGATFVSGRMDALGHGHLVYRCQIATDFTRIGYATNLSGGWQNFEVATLTTFNIPGLSFDISDDGFMHAAYSDGNSVYYMRGSTVTGIWDSPSLAYQSGTSIPELALAARSGTDVQIIAQVVSTDRYLRPMSNRTGFWVASDDFHDNGPTLLSLIPKLTPR